MEGLFTGIIIFGIITFISNVYSKLEGQENNKKMPTFTGNKQPESLQPNEGNRPTKRFSLESLAKEIFAEFDDDFPKKSQNAFEEKNENKVTEPIIYQTSKIEETTRNSIETNQNAILHEKKSNDYSEVPSFIPTSKNELIQAIVTSEILGPPKAKRH